MSDQQENTEQRQEEIRSPQAANEPPQKKPTCKLSILAVLTLLMVIPVMIAASVFADIEKHEDVLQFIAMIFLGFAIIGSPIIAVFSKIRIALSDGRLEGNRTCNIILVFACFLFLYIGSVPFMMVSTRIAERIVCGTNLKRLGQAIQSYADDYDDQLPTAEQWCDILITQADVSPGLFCCRTSGDVKGESSYAMNKNAVGKKLSQVPDNMILLFETNIGHSENEQKSLLRERNFTQQQPDVTYRNPEKHKVHKDRWNQVGGPEDMIQAHSGGTNVLFANGDIEFIQFRYQNLREDSKLKNLCWDAIHTSTPLSAYTSIGERYHNTPQPLIKALTVIIAVVCIAGLALIRITRPWKYPMFTGCIAIGAGIVGLVLGTWGQSLYRPEFYKSVGVYWSIGLSVMAGVCYAGILMRLQNRLRETLSVRRLAVSTGILTGMICSALLHLGFLLLHRTPFGWGFMLTGLPFGIISGAVLGAISGWAICKFYRTQSIEPNVQEGALE